MFIHIWAGGMPFNSDTIAEGQSLGGSETAADCMARELAKLGHNIVLFTSAKQSGKRAVPNLCYEWHGDVSQEYPLGNGYCHQSKIPHDIAIVQRHPLAFSQFTNSKMRILWMHDIAMRRNNDMLERSLPHLDYIFAVSEWHRRQIIEAFKLPEKAVVATSNGIDESLFLEQRIAFQKREPMSLIYTARPERGLEFLVRPGGIMEQLPECKLYICGYDNTAPQMADYYQRLLQRCDELPNVENLGALGKIELYSKIGQAMLQVYPTTFEDTSCIALMEAQYCGTPFITSQIAALPETGQGAGIKLLPLFEGSQFPGGQTVNIPLFVSTVRQVLGDGTEWKLLHDRALIYRRSWSDVAKSWTSMFERRLAEQSSNPYRLRKHFDRHGDIVAMEKAGMELQTGYRKDKKESCMKMRESDMSMEKVKGAKKLHDLGSNPFFEMLCLKLKDALGDVQNASVLDFGCACGEYTMNLRQRFPQVTLWIGIDKSEHHIEMARKRADEINASNMRFIAADNPEVLDCPQASERTRFDAIIVNEVLGHIRDPRRLANSLRMLLKPAGSMLISVPYGPWDAGNPPGISRERLWHFERTDLKEIFGGQPNFQITVVPNNEELGNMIVIFKAGGHDLGGINYNRKLRQQAPTETVSLCMIACNEESNIRRCLEKVRSLVDEIIVGLDETSTDGTRIICERYGAIILNSTSPLKVGFDAARNLSIKAATGDWILWLDADEVVERAELLRPFLRHSPLAGVGIPQYHFSINPPGVPKIDFPCRLFRNGRGVQFYGMVHEHPEVEMNKGIGRTVVAQTTAIAHYGYVTEEIRRERFQRNFELMKQDRKKNPERCIGKMLWVRDLAIFAQLELERSSGKMTPESKGAAHDCIAAFRELLKDRHNSIIRFIQEVLPYYSWAVQALGGGIKYSLHMALVELGDLKQTSPPPVYTFADKKDIKDYTELMLEKATEEVGYKYL
jgi:2-polyprenyl-3-methyl-5-hydroxy-6-metoxy-1,4-benzoquinol methylase/glycosyltransferase involved in cell wall biosynthesis